MQQMVRIAVIDNGILEQSLARGLEKSIVVDESGTCKADLKNMEQQRFLHGTRCAKIIETHLNTCRLVSIRILDDTGKGGLSSLRPAFQWCIRNEIQLINLSLGTTHFADKETIRKLVNEYTQKGLIIIAASANSGYISYPASFSNVIGVSAGERLGINEMLGWQKGIDIEAPCYEETESSAGSLAMMKSNSYAAPFITALVGKLILEGRGRTVPQIKKNLFSLYSKKKSARCLCSLPDFAVHAWIGDGLLTSRAKPYFTPYRGTYQQYQDCTDTILFTEAERFGEYQKTGKHLIYLGKEKIGTGDGLGFYWDIRNRAEQIKNTERRMGEMSLPVIICMVDQRADLFLLLTEMRSRFLEDSYNIFAVSREVESVLYGLEYIPAEFLSGDREKLLDFIYWQTYYQQSDAVLAGVYDDGREKWKDYLKSADMIVLLKCIRAGFYIEIQCDGQVRKKYSIKELNWSMFYQDIVSLLLENEDE